MRFDRAEAIPSLRSSP